jgi:hypothetical protein
VVKTSFGDVQKMEFCGVLRGEGIDEEEAQDARLPRDCTPNRVSRDGRPGSYCITDVTRLDLLPRRNYSAFFLRRRMMIPRKSTARMVQTIRTIFIVLISFPDKS